MTFALPNIYERWKKRTKKKFELKKWVCVCLKYEIMICYRRFQWTILIHSWPRAPRLPFITRSNLFDCSLLFSFQMISWLLNQFMFLECLSVFGATGCHFYHSTVQLIPSRNCHIECLAETVIIVTSSMFFFTVSHQSQFEICSTSYYDFSCRILGFIRFSSIQNCLRRESNSPGEHFRTAKNLQ